MRIPVKDGYSGSCNEWLKSVEQEALHYHHQIYVMNRGRFQDLTIPTYGNTSDRTNMPLSEPSYREEISRNNDPTYPIQDPIHNVTFEIDVIENEDNR